MSHPNDKAPIKKPWFIPIGLVFISAVLVYEGIRLPITNANAGIGSGLMPLLVGFALLLCAGILSWQIANGEQFEPQDVEDADSHSEPNVKELIMIIGATLLAVAVFETLGYVITCTFLFVAVARGLHSYDYRRNFVIGLAVASLSYGIFDRLLGVRLGALIPIMKPIMNLLS